VAKAGIERLLRIQVRPLSSEYETHRVERLQHADVAAVAFCASRPRSRHEDASRVRQARRHDADAGRPPCVAERVAPAQPVSPSPLRVSRPGWRGPPVARRMWCRVMRDVDTDLAGPIEVVVHEDDLRRRCRSTGWNRRRHPVAVDAEGEQLVAHCGIAPAPWVQLVPCWSTSRRRPGAGPRPGSPRGCRGRPRWTGRWPGSRRRCSVGGRDLGPARAAIRRCVRHGAAAGRRVVELAEVVGRRSVGSPP